LVGQTTLVREFPQDGRSQKGRQRQVKAGIENRVGHDQKSIAERNSTENLGGKAFRVRETRIRGGKVKKGRI